MGKVLLSDYSSWYTRLNTVRTRVGLATVNPYETIAAPLKAKSVHMTTLKSQLDDTRTHYNLTGTLAWDTTPGINPGNKFAQQQLTALINTLQSLESVNVAGISYAQTTNSNGTDVNGTNGNGTCSNGVRSNTYRSDGTNSNGSNSNGKKYNGGAYSNGSHVNGVKSNGTKTNGTNAQGSYSQGTNSNVAHNNGTKSNGCTETSNTRETTYTNT